MANSNKFRIEFVLAGFITAVLFGCSGFQRSPGSGYAPGSSGSKSANSSANSSSQNESGSGGLNLPANLTVEERITEFEKRLTSQREKEHYSRLLPWFESKEERLNYLLEPNLNTREKFAQDFGIWKRAQNPSATVLALVRSQDIALGMPQIYVRQSWGEPQRIEISGDPYFKNERWKYVRQVSTPQGFRQEKRTVFFEGGKVAGWDTE